MRVLCWLQVLLPLAAVGGCGPPLSVPGDLPSAVELDPSRPLDAAERSLRVRVASGGRRAEALLLLEGQVSGTALSRIAAGELPSALTARRVPAFTWVEGQGLGLQAIELQEPGAEFTLVALGEGPLARLRTRVDGAPPLERVFPPVGHPAPRAVYCGADGTPVSAEAVSLAPDAFAAALLPGADSRGVLAARCVRLEPAVAVTTDGELALPPSTAGGRPIDPAPVQLVAPSATLWGPGACAPPRLPVGPSCADVEDDRIRVDGLGAPALWVIGAADAEPSVLPALPGEVVELGGLPPGERVQVRGTVLVAGGEESTVEVEVTLAAPRGRVVIQEVLADPLGPEPASEWVELVNAGALAVDLGALVLADATGAVPLPPYRLDPGAFALLVPDGWAATDAGDVPPRAGTPLLRLPRLSTGGLSNEGEALELRSLAGEVMDRFPKVPAPRAGVSLTRPGLGSGNGQRPVPSPGGASPGWHPDVAAR